MAIDDFAPISSDQPAHYVSTCHHNVRKPEISDFAFGNAKQANIMTIFNRIVFGLLEYKSSDSVPLPIKYAAETGIVPRYFRILSDGQEPLAPVPVRGLRGVNILSQYIGPIQWKGRVIPYLLQV